jgi:hypothetical protein
MQPLIGQTLTHWGLSYSPSHSVHSFALMIVKPFFSLMEAVGHSGSQSPQEVHKSALIFIAMIIFLSSSSGKRFGFTLTTFPLTLHKFYSAASNRLARSEIGNLAGAGCGSM